MNIKDSNIAIVHDWFLKKSFGGAEKVTIILNDFLKHRYSAPDIFYIDRAFWTALFFFLISQLADVQYFDGKISLITWILMAGLKNIISEKDYQNLSSK